MQCLENPDSAYGAQYKVDYTLMNAGKTPVTFDQMSVCFENNISDRRANLLIHDFNKTTIGAGKEVQYTYYTGKKTDMLMKASKNGKTAFAVLLYNNSEDAGVIFMQMSELPSIIAKNGHAAELSIGEKADLRFTENTESVTRKVNS